MFSRVSTRADEAKPNIFQTSLGNDTISGYVNASADVSIDGGYFDEQVAAPPLDLPLDGQGLGPALTAIANVPEPGPGTLLAVGVGVAAFWNRRRLFMLLTGK